MFNRDDPMFIVWCRDGDLVFHERTFAGLLSARLYASRVSKHLWHIHFAGTQRVHINDATCFCCGYYINGIWRNH